MQYDFMEDEDCKGRYPQGLFSTEYQHWSSDSENAGSPVLDRVLEDTAAYLERSHQSEPLTLLQQEPVTEEMHATMGSEDLPTEKVKDTPGPPGGIQLRDDQLGQKRTLEQSRAELAKWRMTVFELWTKNVMSQPHWKHAVARTIIEDIIDDAVDFSDCRYKILGDGNEVRLNFDKQFVCNDSCMEFTIRGWFKDRPLLLDACTCCRLTTTKDVRALLMRIARRWEIKKLNFLTLHFTTRVDGIKFEVRGDLVKGMRQRGVLDFHFCAL